MTKLYCTPWNRRRVNSSGLAFRGQYTIECYDSEGNLKWREVSKNAVVNGALNSILDVYLRNQTQIASWYLGLIDNASYSALAAGDTMSSHSGWIESSAYSQSTRPQWSPGAASGQSISNGTSVDFSVNATATIKGVFLASDNTKGGTTGTLFSTALFSGGNQAVANGDTLKVTYSVTASAV
jgi:hypothetical protein